MGKSSSALDHESPPLGAYPRERLPSAADCKDRQIVVVDAGGARSVVFSDGTEWKPVGPAYLGTVADETAMLALTAAVGDTAYRTDVSAEFRCIALPSSSAANWRQIPGGAKYLGPMTWAALQGGAYADGSPGLAALPVDATVFVTDRLGAYVPNAGKTAWVVGLGSTGGDYFEVNAPYLVGGMWEY